ncbi:response regulator transcription factor [Vibrio ulleungensis]|jgi:two-component system nitrate/nitrite response regulator NarL|uniref:Response regulator transcription factor n=1 Tax=Vibrio ulleungensis TaxID=2807619 RepID=A0ABS2HFQ1_9VIBR|nr:response regulator transcription factor [Vibrio ulleungensis]MBM7035904.1 response regulator transcription factor [Vibrio ulleungensis]
MQKIRIVIVDDHQVVQDGFKLRLDMEASFEVVGLASNGVQAIEVIEDVTPDVVLMDINMPLMNGVEATTELKSRHPNLKILMLTMHEDKEYIMQAMQAGAMGYLLKEISSDKLVQAIKTVYSGGTYFCKKVTETLFSEPPRKSESTEPNPLSRREESVLKLIAQGESNKRIATNLDISVRTVETHRQNIKHKLKIQTAAGLAKYALERGML